MTTLVTSRAASSSCRCVLANVSQVVLSRTISPTSGRSGGWSSQPLVPRTSGSPLFPQLRTKTIGARSPRARARRPVIRWSSGLADSTECAGSNMFA